MTPEQLAQRALVLEEPALDRAKITCVEIGPLAGALYTQNHAADARGLWRSHCGARDALLADGGFDAARLNETSPFAWQFEGEGGLDLRLEPGVQGSGQTLVAASSLPRRRIVAIQALQLTPGSYRFSWLARDAAGAPSPRIAARLTCKRGQGPWLDAAPMRDGGSAALAAVSDECPLQWLELALDPGSGTVRLDDVRLAPAG